MNIKKILIGEPMPDKNDPKYKERYESEVAAGKTFAEKGRLNWAIIRIQQWANNHRVSFLVIVFGIVLGCFAMNIYNMVRYYNASKEQKRKTAVERVDEALKQQRESHKNQ